MDGKLPMNYHLRNIYSENTVQSFQPHPNLELTPKIPNLLLMIQIQMRGLNKLFEHETSTPLNIFATKATAPTTKNSTKSLKLSNPTTNITRRTLQLPGLKYPNAKKPISNIIQTQLLSMIIFQKPQISKWMTQMIMTLYQQLHKSTSLSINRYNQMNLHKRNNWFKLYQSLKQVTNKSIMAYLIHPCFRNKQRVDSTGNASN